MQIDTNELSIAFNLGKKDKSIWCLKSGGEIKNKSVTNNGTAMEIAIIILEIVESFIVSQLFFLVRNDIAYWKFLDICD